MFVRKLDKKIHLYFTFMCQIMIHFADENRLSSLHRSDKFAQTSLVVGILLWLLVVSVSIDFSTSTFHACCFVLTLRWELQVKRGLKAGICFIDAFALPAGGQVPRFLVLPVGGQDPFVSLPLFLSRVSGGRRS